MSESTLEAPPIAEPAAPEYEPSAAPVPWTLRGFVRDHPWWATAVALLVFSTGVVLWAGTRPSFDAYGFLVWGQQTLRLTLDLGGAPSWKPLPYLFTLPFALAGHYQLWLWMITCVAVSLAGSILAGRIVYRLVAHDPDSIGDRDRPEDARYRRYAAIAAAIFAGLALLGFEDTPSKIPYLHFILSAQSDPMLVTFCLAAVDSHLLGRYRWAFAFGVLAALGRPEAWPFLAAYSIWAWLRVPTMRWFLFGGWLVVLFMWFGIPTITNHRPLVSAQLAEKSPRELHSNKVTGTVDRFIGIQYLPMWIAALLAVAVAAVRRNRLVLLLAAGVVGWVAVEIAFAIHGWAALPRYMFEPAGIAVVLAGVGVGWLLVGLPRLVRGLPRWAGIPLVAVLIGTLVPGAVARVRVERTDRHHEQDRTHEIALLQTTTRLLGGAKHVQNCGQPVTNVEYVSAMAWFYHLNVGYVGGLQQHVEAQALAQKHAQVQFIPLSHGGWKVAAVNIPASKQARCRGLNARYEVTGRHPGGVLVR